jgi:hypothetical protein
MPGTPIAQGIRKQTVFAKQSGLNVPATGAGGQILRRENSVFKLDKAKFESDEMVSHQQSTGARHGLQSVTGKISGLLSPATYKLLMATAMRKDFAAGATTGALVTVTAAPTTGAAGTFTRAAGSYLTDGFKVGDVVRWVGFLGGSAPTNNAHNFRIDALTALVMTGTMLDGVAVVADAAGDSVTCTVVGKKTLAPLTGHTDDLFTFEEWQPDIARSEMFSDCKLNAMTVDFPANGNCKTSFDFIGLRRDENGAQQLTTPAAETTTPILATVVGSLQVNGVTEGIATSLQLSIQESVTPDGPVVFSQFSPDLSRGRIKVSGSFSAYFTDHVLSLIYKNETAISIVVIVLADNTPNSDFIAFNLSRVKLDGDAPDDGEKGIIRAYPFTAEINVLGGAALASDQTIMSIQDSAA